MSDTNSGGTCWNCRAALTPLDYGRGDTCGQCGRDTRVCKGCVHYDPTCHNECRENQADRVIEKERSNFCDYFKPITQTTSEGNPSPTAARDAMKSAAEALFKKK